MEPVPPPGLTCPICAAALTLDARTWRCPAGHAYDRAREGYVDLLPVGHGRSGISGDTAAMARARRRFLSRGPFDPLTRRVVARTRAHVASGADGRRPVVAEAGCGTGHYVGAVADALPDAALYGFDVSRDVLRLAARDHPLVTFAVNDVTHRLCLADGAADVLLDAFAPRNPAEFRRVLRPDGLLLVVVPGEGHLHELRARVGLLGIEPEKRERTIERLAPAFELAWEEALEWRAELSGEAVADLAAMGPSAFHRGDDDPSAGEARAAEAADRVTLSFILLGFRPGAPPGSSR